MKTRNGLVSNSSSSSFVVAFPKKPKTPADVWNTMFFGKDGGISVYERDGLSYSQVSTDVFNSLKDKLFKRATLKDIVEEFENRYHYYINSSTIMFDGQETDKHGGCWSEKIDKYCGSDPKLLEELRQEILKSEQLCCDLRDEETQILKRGPKEVPYAWGGHINYSTKKPYTKEQIKRYKKYSDDVHEFKRSDEEYIAYVKKRNEHWHDEKKDKLKKKLATVDAKAFMRDNEGKFIFIVSYSDNDGGDGSTMEHGNVFKNVPHIRISHH